jgi:hypothetical protein
VKSHFKQITKCRTFCCSWQFDTFFSED